LQQDENTTNADCSKLLSCIQQNCGVHVGILALMIKLVTCLMVQQEDVGLLYQADPVLRQMPTLVLTLHLLFEKVKLYFHVSQLMCVIKVMQERRIQSVFSVFDLGFGGSIDQQKPLQNGLDILHHCQVNPFQQRGVLKYAIDSSHLSHLGAQCNPPSSTYRTESM
jgi:hypothetical protein